MREVIYQIKIFIRNNVVVMNILSKIYRLIFRTVKRGNISIEWNGAFLKKARIDSKGQNNKVKFGNGCRIKNLNIRLIGDNNSVEFAEDCTGSDVKVWCSDGGIITVGQKIYFAGNIQIACTEGAKIVISDNSLFADSVTLRTGDSHAIYNGEGQRINEPQDIIIGEHVWIGSQVVILKGSIVHNGSVIGANSLLTGKEYEGNSIIGGSPAQIIKKGIYWEHDLP